MSWQFTNDRPIYTQLIEQITIMIIRGTFAPGSRLPSVRDMAAEAKVNPNTMQRALADLEAIGLIYTERTNGKFVSGDNALIEHHKQQLATLRIENFFKDMADLAIDWQQSLQLAAATKEKVGISHE